MIRFSNGQQVDVRHSLSLIRTKERINIDGFGVLIYLDFEVVFEAY